MGIFGGKPRTGGFGEVYPAPAPQAQPRRSLFGRAGGWLRSRDWERVGAALRDDPSVLSDLMQGRRQDQLVALQMAEAQRAQQQRDAQFSAAKGVEDPTQRALATADPSQWLEGERTSQQARGQYQWQREYDAENPEPITPYQQAQIDLTRRGQDLDYSASQTRASGAPTLPELRQWTNSYNDDVQQVYQGLGNARAAIPYAFGVVSSGGNPPSGVNARMSDVQLLRAAARAQTGPGVLTESEVFGTLSPSLQQEIRRQGAYFDASRVTLTAQDRLALARNVTQGASDAAGDLWRRYDAAENVLASRGIRPDQAGVPAPDLPHPDDWATLNSTRGRYTVGEDYVTPSGRVYTYGGPGRWRFVRRGGTSRRQAVQTGAPASGGQQPVIVELD